MKRMTVVLALAAGLMAGWPTRAHEQGGRAMGVVKSVTAEQIVLQTPDGHLVEFVVTKDTLFLQGGRAARREDVRVGRRAVIQGERSGERLQAVRVKLGPPGGTK
jgi:hypothetical protein